jgi:hypothetical protein
MRVVLAVAALLVTAGCVGVSNPGLSDGHGLAPTPEAGYPPGVDADGLQNASRLLEAHVTQARSAGYEFEYEREARTVEANATRAKYVRRVQCEARRTTRVLERDCQTTKRTGTNLQNQSTRKSHVWANQSVSLRQYRTDDNVSYALRDSQLGSAADVGAITPMFEASYHVKERIVVDGLTLVVLVDDGSTFETLTGNATMESRLVVDTEGRIHEFDATIERDEDGERFMRSLSYELTDLGVEEIPPPDWREAAYDLDAISLDTHGGTYLLTVSHGAGVPIPANSTLRITHEGRVTEFTLDDPVGRYETLAVAFRASDLRPVLVDTAEFTSQGYLGVEGDYRIELVTPGGTHLLDGGVTVEMSFTNHNPYR